LFGQQLLRGNKMRKSVLLLLPALLAGCVITPGASVPNPALPPSSGTISHSPGQSESISVLAGGGIAASSVNAACNGFVTEAPNLSVDNSTLAGIIALDIAATSLGDTTLLVRTPGGQWLCDDDSGGNLNPALHITGPVNGQYDVWVGTFAPGARVNATVRVY
jgi:hypothetical protein